MKDRRKYQRFELGLKVGIDHGGQFISGRALDISLGGALLQAPDLPPYNIEDQIVLRLQLPSKSPGFLLLKGIIRYSYQNTYGIEFFETETAALKQLRTFLISLSNETIENRRHFWRSIIDARTEIMFDGKIFHGQVKDISVRGIHVESETLGPRKEGTEVQLVLCPRGGNKTAPILSRLVYTYSNRFGFLFTVNHEEWESTILNLIQ